MKALFTLQKGLTMSDYKKKANFKDSIISGVVVLLILIAGVVLIVNQFSEVDLSKKELEELRAEVRLAEVELLEKQDKWDNKVSRDSKSVSEQEAELNAAWENFEREKANFKKEIAALKKKYTSGTTSRAQMRREIEKEMRAKYKSSGSSKGNKQLSNAILTLEAQNELLQQELAEYTKWKKNQNLSKQKAASANQKKKAQAEILKLMNEFAAFDVDLKQPDWCDRDYSARFYKAETKLNEIKQVMKKNGLTSSYKSYLANASRNEDNGGSPDGWCNGVKM